jgi:DNA-binding IclR family transcriptional regulator
MTTPPEVNRPVETVERSVAVLEFLKAEGTATLSEIADELDCAKSTAHRHLKTLEASSFLVGEGKAYRLGVRFLDYGVAARDRHALFAEARPKVDELAAETDEKIWCTIEEHGRSVHIYGARGKHSVRTHARVGQRHYLHQHAAGKSILAHLPPGRVDEILGVHGLPARTPDTLTDPEELRAELETVRERGYAFNLEESVEGLHAVGAPITDEDGRAIGAISISGPANRLSGTRLREELPDLLLGVVNEISINLAHA